MLNEILSALYTFVVFKKSLTLFRETFDLHISEVYKDLLTALKQKNQMFIFPAPLGGVIAV